MGSADAEDMAVPESPDPRLLEELEQLEGEERAVSAARRRLHDRLASFPNESTRAREQQISAERKDLHRRIDDLRNRLQGSHSQTPD